MWGSSCGTAVEHMPAEQNSWGHGFDSGQVLGCFMLFLSLSGVSLIRSLQEVQHYWFFLHKKMEAWLCSLGQNKHNMHIFGKKL